MIHRGIPLIIILLLHGVYCLFIYKPYTFLRGDSLIYAFMAKSLWEDRDLDITDDFPFAIPDDPEVSHLALGKDGTFVPKHPPLLPILALPFYAVWGFSGFLLFNIVSYIGIFMLYLWILPEKIPRLTAFFLLAYFFMPIFFHYFYNFSPDVLISMIVLASWLFILQKHDLMAGWIAGFAVFLRPLYLLLIIQNFFFSKRKKSFLVGCFIGLLPWMLYNTSVFGLPWKTGYSQTLYMGPQGLQTFNHAQLLRLTPQYIFPLLFHFPQGLLFSAPLVLLLLVFALKYFRQRPFTHGYILIFALWHLLWYACYANLPWQSSIFGNRYLLPLIFLAPVVLIPEQKDAVK